MGCWLLGDRFTIFYQIIVMNFVLPLCFNYSLLLKNADYHSTDSFTHHVSEKNSLRSYIFNIIHNISCWFLGWVYWKVLWWQMVMVYWWIGNIPENMLCVEITLPRDTFPQQIPQGLPWKWNSSSTPITRCLTAYDKHFNSEVSMFKSLCARQLWNCSSIPT